MFIYIPFFIFIGAVLFLLNKTCSDKYKIDLYALFFVLLSLIVFLAVAILGVAHVQGPMFVGAPATALGAVVASIVFGGGPKSARGTQRGSPSDSSKSDWGIMAILAAAALLLVFVTLEYDYRMIRGMSKISAAGVDLEFGRDSRASYFQTAFPERGMDTKPALPRTQSLFYVSREIERLSRYVAEDRQLARLVTGTMNDDEEDIVTEYLESYFCSHLAELGHGLFRLQDKNKSEFPSLAEVGKISHKLRLLVQIIGSRQSSRPDKPASASADLSEDLKVVKTMEANTASELDAEIASLEHVVGEELTLLDAESDRSQPEDWVCPKRPAKRRASTETINELMTLFSAGKTEEGTSVGYFSALAALALFADNNKESAIQLLDERILKELQYIDESARISINSVGANSKYVITKREIIRKKSMIARLIRLEGTLTNYTNYSTGSTKFDRLMWKRSVRGIGLYKDIIQSMIERSEEIGNRGRMQSNACVGRVDSVYGAINFDKLSTNFDEKKILAKVMNLQLIFKNNALSVVGTDSAIMLSPEHGFESESRDLVLDEWSRQLVEVARNVECLKRDAGFEIANSTPSDMLDTVGSYYELKAKNYLKSDDSGDGPGTDQTGGVVPEISERISAACKAIAAFDEARMHGEEIARPRAAEDSLDRLVEIQETDERQIYFADKVVGIKKWLTDTYAKGEIDKHCSLKL